MCTENNKLQSLRYFALRDENTFFFTLAFNLIFYVGLAASFRPFLCFDFPERILLSFDLRGFNLPDKAR